MKRGPKQPSFKATIWIATEYEKRRRKVAERLALQRIDTSARQFASQTERGWDAKKEGFDAVAELREAQNRVEKVPVVQVKKRGRLEERRARSDSQEEALEDVRYWQEAIRGNREAWGIGAIVARLPNGWGQTIRETVAAKASKRYRRKITAWSKNAGSGTERTFTVNVLTKLRT